MDMSLGSAVVAVEADLTKLLEGFKQAKAYRDAFEKDMATGSAGLLKLTDAADKAGKSVADQGEKTKTTGDKAKKTTDDLNKLADANKKVEDSSKAASAAIETEAQKNERLALMVDRSLAKLNERNRLARTPAASWVGGTVPKEAGVFEAQNALMGLEKGKIPAAVLDGAAVAGGAKVATAGLKAEEKAVEELSAKFKVNSSVIREAIVLIREASRGDFTRMAGSASLLGQNLGLIEAAGVGLTAGFVGLAGAVAVLGVAFLEGAKDASRFANMLALTGNYAGLTAASYQDMAEKIAGSTGTSVASNQRLIASLASTNDFTKSEIESLVVAAETLSRATGKSAEDVVKDFEKMAQGPTKYAESFQRAYIGSISQTQLELIRKLEETGHKEEALAQLIQIQNEFIASNTLAQTGIIISAWNGATNAVSNFWTWLKRIGTDSTSTEQIAALNQQIALVGKQAANPESVAFYKNLIAQRDALVATAKATEQKAGADAKAAQQTAASDAAIEKINDRYLKGIDSQSRFKNAVKDLNSTLADSLKMSRDTPVATLLAAAAKSGIAAVRDLGSSYSEQVTKLKKENLPDVFKADAKAAREAAAEAKKLAREAEALAKRRKEAIDIATLDRQTLESLAPLYANHNMSVHQMGVEIAIATELYKLHLSASSPMGKKLADEKRAADALSESYKAQQKVREELDAAGLKVEEIDAEIATVGKEGGALAALREELKLTALAKKAYGDQKIPEDVIADIKDKAAQIGAATEKLDLSKFTDETGRKFRDLAQSIQVEAAAMGLSREAAAAYTEEMTLLNEAQQKHIQLSPAEVSAITRAASAYGQSVEAMARFKEAQDAANFSVDQFQNAIEDAIFSGKSFMDVLHNLVTAFAKASVEATLFGTGPLAGILGGPSSASNNGQGGGMLGGLMHREANKVFGVNDKQLQVTAANAQLERTTADLIAFSMALQRGTLAAGGGASALGFGMTGSSYPVGGSGIGDLFDTHQNPTGAYSQPLITPEQVQPINLGLDSLTQSMQAATDATNAQVPALNEFGQGLVQVLSGLGGNMIPAHITGGGGGIFKTLLGIGKMFAGSVNFGGSVDPSGFPSGLSDSITNAAPIGDAFSLPSLNTGLPRFAGGGQSGVGSSGPMGGGLARGPGSGASDSILGVDGSGRPFRFADGEFIVNEQATKNFLPVLESINAGRMPRFAGGGALSSGSGPQMGGRSIQFGDIHIHGAGGGDERSQRRTAKQYAGAIRREIADQAKTGLC